MRHIIILAIMLLLVSSNVTCVAFHFMMPRARIETPQGVWFSGSFGDIEIPSGWTLWSAEVTPLYSSVQWKSPRSHTGIGVVSVDLPFSMSEQTLIGLIRSRYSLQEVKTSEHYDQKGRHWLEGETGNYHATGFPVIKGRHVWIVYGGYRLSDRSIDTEADFKIAVRFIETFKEK